MHLFSRQSVKIITPAFKCKNTQLHCCFEVCHCTQTMHTSEKAQLTAKTELAKSFSDKTTKPNTHMGDFESLQFDNILI